MSCSLPFILVPSYSTVHVRRVLIINLCACSPGGTANTLGMKYEFGNGIYVSCVYTVTITPAAVHIDCNCRHGGNTAERSPM